jgi:hypothetical protein
MANSPQKVNALYANAHPHIGWHVQTRSEFGHSLGALRQHLKLVLGRLSHDLEYLPHVLIGNFVVEEVRHAVHKHKPARLPLKREGQRFWN